MAKKKEPNKPNDPEETDWGGPYLSGGGLPAPISRLPRLRRTKINERILQLAIRIVLAEVRKGGKKAERRVKQAIRIGLYEAKKASRKRAADRVRRRRRRR
jgi:hypothetical protein